MRNLFLCSLLLLVSTVFLSARTPHPFAWPLHLELVGTFVFEQYSNQELILTAVVEKRLLTKALKQEGDCQPKDMLRVCGDRYLAEHFNVQVNGGDVIMTQESLSVGKDYITVSYLLSSSVEKVSQVSVKSDYLMEYNHHGVLRVVFDMGAARKSYTLKPSKKSIIASFK